MPGRPATCSSSHTTTAKTRYRRVKAEPDAGHVEETENILHAAAGDEMAGVLFIEVLFIKVWVEREMKRKLTPIPTTFPI